MRNHQDLDEYAERHTTPESPLLAMLNRQTHLTQVYPQMLSGHLQGALLRMISLMVKPRRVLEVGTFTGYSALCLASGLIPENEPGGPGILHTIEVNPEQEDGIRQVIDEAGMERTIILHIGNAEAIIPELKETWDIIYLDADKTGYPEYYRMVLPSLRSGGILIADNVLWDGKVLGEQAGMDRDTRAIVEFNEFVHKDPRVENLLLPVRDGLMIVRKL